MRFMSSGFGGILIFIGAIFLLSRIETSSESTVSGKGGSAGFSTKSSSPGVVMVVVGALLMISPNFATQKIKVEDSYPSVAPGLSVEAGWRPSDTPKAEEIIKRLMRE